MQSTEKYLPESGKIKPNLGCNYVFPIDLAPNESPFVAKSIGKATNNSDLV